MVGVSLRGFVVQGSGLSYLLFAVIMEMISREFRVDLPWELLHAYDLVVLVVSEEEVIRKLNVWREDLEKKKLRVNHTLAR